MRPLNLDILTYVLKYLSSPEALSISTVCKTVHSIVVREVLSDVTLDSFNAASRFPDFIFTGRSNRLPLLRKLTVDDDVFVMDDCDITLDSIKYLDEEDLLPFDFAAFLTQILTQSRHLRALSLPLSGYFIQKYPKLRAALIEYDALVELTLSNVTGEVLQVVQNMHSSLHVLSLRYPEGYDVEVEDEDGFPRFLSCMTTHPQLQKLSFQGVEDEAYLGDDGIQAQWSSVHSLEVSGAVPLALLVESFPNLRSLRAEWLTNDIADEHGLSQWTGLDYLWAPPDSVLRWSFQCPVRWLDLSPVLYMDDSRSNPGGEPDLRLVHTLERTQPMILTINAAFNVKPSFWETLAHSQIKVLDVAIRYLGDDVSVDQWVDTLSRTLHLLQAPYLRIRFKEEVADPHMAKQTAMKQAEALTGLQDVLAKSLPHLQFLAIQIEPYICGSLFHRSIEISSDKSPPKRTWWRIRRYDETQETRRRSRRLLPPPRAELIPEWKGEKLWSRLHAMDYDSLLKLKPDEITLD